jgi:predicted aspartyl protease/Tfp pilus assembly protein PilF
MRRCLAATLSVALALPLLLLAQVRQSATADIEIQLGDLLMNEARFKDAVEPYRRAMETAGDDQALRRRAHAGLVLALLRTGDFTAARTEAQLLTAGHADDARAQALYGDTLWASGLFEEAEHAFDTALKADTTEARAHHGRARALTARTHLADALAEAQEALRLAPREAEFHHTVGVIYERQHRYGEAASAFGNYVNLLPNRDRSEKAMWTRAEIRFLDSFNGRTPVEVAGTSQTWTVPIRIEKEKVLVKLRVNGSGPTEFVLDTGAEQTVVSRDLARKRGVVPITYMQSAGVGDIGLRGLQIGRIDSLEVGDLKVRNVPCLIKNPPLGDLPTREPESFSPLALGLSMRIDYVTRQLVMARTLPQAQYATQLPLYLYRLATVRGIVNGQPATFVVDTGGEVISISQTTAGQLAVPGAFRRIPLKVYGTSGWDKDAFLMPNVDLEFSSIRFSKIPVVVLNLKAPSALLGYQLGGIVGHKFLSKYRVSIDLDRSVVGLDSN